MQTLIYRSLAGSRIFQLRIYQLRDRGRGFGTMDRTYWTCTLNFGLLDALRLDFNSEPDINIFAHSDNKVHDLFCILISEFINYMIKGHRYGPRNTWASERYKLKGSPDLDTLMGP